MIVAYGFWVIFTILQPHLLPHGGDIPRSNFQFDFGLEKKVLAEAGKDNPNWSKFGVDNLPTKASDTSSSSKVFFLDLEQKVPIYAIVTCVNEFFPWLIMQRLWLTIYLSMLGTLFFCIWINYLLFPTLMLWNFFPGYCFRSHCEQIYSHGAQPRGSSHCRFELWW